MQLYAGYTNAHTFQQFTSNNIKNYQLHNVELYCTNNIPIQASVPVLFKTTVKTMFQKKHKKVITLVSSCGRFPVLWTNNRQAHLTFLVNVWMIDLCLERNLWRLERIFGWKIYPNTECTLVVWWTLLHA